MSGKVLFGILQVGDIKAFPLPAGDYGLCVLERTCAYQSCKPEFEFSSLDRIPVFLHLSLRCSARLSCCGVQTSTRLRSHGLCRCQIMAYFYSIFLVILLVDRAFRDDLRCAAKYTTYWDEYRKLVPYKILPFVL